MVVTMIEFLLGWTLVSAATAAVVGPWLARPKKVLLPVRVHRPRSSSSALGN
jgi:hypothetical protein